MQKKCEKAPKRACPQKDDGTREASSEGGEAPPKGGVGGRLVKYRFTRWGVEGPPRIVYASRSPPRRTSNIRFPLEHGSNPRETLAKRVSDDLQFLIFRRQKKRSKKNKSHFFLGFP